MDLTDRNTYVTDKSACRSLLSRLFLSSKLMFYPQVAFIVTKYSIRAAMGLYDGAEWARSSKEIVRALENIGVVINITGVENIRKLQCPAVFIGNHMSTLETFVLPGIMQPIRETTFVVKKSLVDMPVFGRVMRSRDPVVVGRVNPREDLKTVIEQGSEKLRAGRSIVIFPQSTRAIKFDPAEFNTLGIKLALKANVPVVPLALKTDAWGIGRWIKEFGPIDKHKKVHFSFGEPMIIKGRGVEEQKYIIKFIQDNLDKWSREDI